MQLVSWLCHPVILIHCHSVIFVTHCHPVTPLQKAPEVVSPPSSEKKPGTVDLCESVQKSVSDYRVLHTISTLPACWGIGADDGVWGVVVFVAP